jgi:RNA polymerase sigma-70 factor (ECF subfamily)
MVQPSSSEDESTKSESELIRASLAGEHEAFRILYRRYVAKVRSTLLRLSGPEHLNDLTQETFVLVWRNLHRIKSSESFASWVYRISANVALDNLRARKRRVQSVAFIEEPISHLDETSSHENRQLVTVALEALDFNHRCVLVLHDLEQLTEKDIAVALNIPIGTVKSRLFHARSRAREFLIGKGVNL